ncbi:MAG: hydrogenase maturation nickel metallochaperone HypA [Thermodesulfobacteriota bacterium]
MAITRSMLEAVGREMEKSVLERLKRVSIRVGELAAVEPEALRFCFEAAVKGTPMEGALLDIEEVPLTGRCAPCSADFRIDGFAPVCPRCGNRAIERLTGTELDLVSIEAD